MRAVIRWRQSDGAAPDGCDGRECEDVVRVLFVVKGVCPDGVSE